MPAHAISDPVLRLASTLHPDNRLSVLFSKELSH